MCVKRILNYLNKIRVEFFKPENITKYIIYFLIGLSITAIFQYFIIPHPKIQLSSDCSNEDTCRIRIKNIGNKATENLQFRVLYDGNCALGIDPAELSYMNSTNKRDFAAPYNEPPYSKKWIISNVELNPGVEFSFFCQKTFPFQIRITGSNFREIVNLHNP